MKKEIVLQKLQELYPSLHKNFGITKIGIFGSLARDAMKNDSDIDIVFEMSTPDLLATVHVKKILEQTLNYPVDVVRYRSAMNPYLKKRIEQEAIYA